MAHRKHVKGQIVLSRPPSQHLDSLTEELPSIEILGWGNVRVKKRQKLTLEIHSFARIVETTMQEVDRWALLEKLLNRETHFRTSAQVKAR